MALSNWTFGKNTEADLEVVASANGYNDLIRSSTNVARVDMAVSGSDTYSGDKTAWSCEAVIYDPVSGTNDEHTVTFVLGMSASDLTDSSTWTTLDFPIGFRHYGSGGGQTSVGLNVPGDSYESTDGIGVNPGGYSLFRVRAEMWRPEPGLIRGNYYVDAGDTGSWDAQSVDALNLNPTSTVDPSTFVAHGMRLNYANHGSIFEEGDSPYVAEVEFGWN